MASRLSPRLRHKCLLTVGSAQLPALSPSHGDSGSCTLVPVGRGWPGPGCRLLCAATPLPPRLPMATSTSPKEDVPQCCGAPGRIAIWVFLQHPRPRGRRYRHVCLASQPCPTSGCPTSLFLLSVIHQGPEEVGSLLPPLI